MAHGASRSINLTDGVIAPDTQPSIPSKVAMKTTKGKSKSVHPTYAFMIREAILTMKQRTGSSRPALRKFIGAKYKLPDGWEKKLSLYLKKMTLEGALVQVKASWKLGDKLKKEAVKAKKATKTTKAVAKKTTAATKPKAVAKKTTGDAKKKVKRAAAKSKQVVKRAAPKNKQPTKKSPAAKKKPVAKRASKRAAAAKK